MTMRIAIAGGGGFAFILAAEIAQSTNAVLILSTRVSTLQEDIVVAFMSSR